MTVNGSTEYLTYKATTILLMQVWKVLEVEEDEVVEKLATCIAPPLPCLLKGLEFEQSKDNPGLYSCRLYNNHSHRRPVARLQVTFHPGRVGKRDTVTSDPRNEKKTKQIHGNGYELE